MDNYEGHEQPTQSQQHSHQASKDIERVTDYADEAEVDTAKMAKAMSFISSAVGNQPSSTTADSVQQKQQTPVHTWSKEDVDFLVNEMGVSKQLAENALRQHSGQVKGALVWLLDRPQYFA